MNNDVRQDALCRLVQFEGELRPDHVEALNDMTGGDRSQMLVDCRRVTRYVDGAIEALVAHERRVSEAGGKVLLVGVRHPLLRTTVLLEPSDQPCFGESA